MSQPSDRPENRLAGESSPYLLLHRHNPVDWYPWGDEALARAKAEDKPIFLSVGYSTCYWCHVMERESFSDPEVAELMNREFVNIKLDREERPDLDEIYMAATQILAGQGGWPNSVFLTPDLKPFYAGTYFPPEGRHGLPAFGSVLESLADAFASRRDDVESQAEEMEGAMRRFLEERMKPALVAPQGGAAERAVEALGRRFDETWGGFGTAPKFPTPSNLFLLLELADETRAGEMLSATLDRMARGGLYDQLGGGFHRYATDREWKVPHFEKMLYDNGLLLEVYAREAGRGGELATQAARIVRETAAFLAREMTSPEGAFWSAIDAETHGHEGAFYVWTRGEIANVLGAEDAAFLAPLLGFDGKPFFEGTHYVLHLPESWAEAARRRRLPEEELRAEALPLLEKLLAARGRRERPATDDKILTDWNGTAITGLAVAGMLLGEPDYVARAARAADFLLDTLRSGGGPLLHAWRAGKGKIAAYLSDYAFLVRGLLALHEATREERYLRAAAELTEEQIARLADPAGGFFVAGERPDLLFRSKEIFDGAMPAANAVATLNLLELADRTGRADWRERAEAALKAFGPLVEGVPDAVKMMAIAARRFARQGAAHAAAPMAAPASGIPALEDDARGTVAARLTLGDRGADGARAFRLAVEIAPGWHLCANPPGVEGLLATTVTAADGGPVEARYPPPSRPAAGEEPAIYEGTVEITGKLRGDGGLVLTCQPCDASRCLPPVSLPVETPARRREESTGGSPSGVASTMLL